MRGATGLSRPSSMPRLRATVGRHPRLPLALKTTAAATTAWLLVQPMGGFVDDYPYYAPLGAVVAMSLSVVDSMRSSLRALAAISTGAALGLVLHALPLPQPVALLVGIGTGILLGGVRGFGVAGGWVPFATLFVLIASGDDPWSYALAYAALTGFGALVGVLLNLAMPQLPLTPSVVAQEELQREVADQLRRLADELEREDASGEADWAAAGVDLAPQVRLVQELSLRAQEARRGNWLARRWASVADEHLDRARALLRLTGSVDAARALVVDTRAPVHGADPAARELRPLVAAALRAVAAMLAGDETPDAADAAAAVAAVRRSVARAVAESGERYLSVAAVAVDLDDAVEAWR
jgi:uncharacterized membrane protein YgaE (UPF0421/DUF939 family)